MYELCNSLRLFEEYYKEFISENSSAIDMVQRNGDFSYNLWKFREQRRRGEQAYCLILQRQLTAILTRSLNSLKKNVVLQWENCYYIVPDLFYSFYNTQYRVKSDHELEEEYRQHISAIKKEADQMGSVLDCELVTCLINGIGRRKNTRRSDLPRKPGAVIRCTPYQEAAIDNYQLYLRQLSYMSYFQLDTLPNANISVIRNAGKFFISPDLMRTYKCIDFEMRSRLFGNIVFWKEVHYQIIDAQKAAEFRPEDFHQDKEFAYQVTKNVISYVESQMSRTGFEFKKELDSPDFCGFGEPIPGKRYHLISYSSAVTLHTRLKSLYKVE